LTSSGDAGAVGFQQAAAPDPDGGAVVAFFRKQMDDRSERAGTRP
jgi:hypothetical protein